MVSYGVGSLGLTAPAVYTAGSETDSTVAVQLTGLQSRTTYQFLPTFESDGGPFTPAQALEFTTLPEPPTAVLDPTTDITRTTATLNATVDSDGAGFDAKFRVTPENGVAFETSELGSSGDASFSQALDQLKPGTTYSVELLVSSAGGDVTTPSAGFTTLSDEPGRDRRRRHERHRHRGDAERHRRPQEGGGRQGRASSSPAPTRPSRTRRAARCRRT